MVFGFWFVQLVSNIRKNQKNNKNNMGELSEWFHALEDAVFGVNSGSSNRSSSSSSDDDDGGWDYRASFLMSEIIFIINLNVIITLKIRLTKNVRMVQPIP